MAGAGRLLAALVAATTLVACGGDAAPVVAVTARPLQPTPSATATPSPTVTSPTATMPPTPTPTPTPSVTGPHPPTDTDRARFLAAYAPPDATDLQQVATDLDADGVEELVFTYVRAARVAHVDVAWWSGTAYEVTFDQDAGPGTTIERVRIADVNADGRMEIVTFQEGDGAASLTIWQVAGPRQIVALPAHGGCHDGSNTYGVIGATLEDRDGDGVDEIYATCDDSPLPVGAWSSDRYLWQDGAYRHVPELLP